MSIQKAIPESESFTPELARTNKNQTYERQADYLQSLFTDGLIIKDIGSGLNYKRKGLLSLLGRDINGAFNIMLKALRDTSTNGVTISFQMVPYSETSGYCQIFPG